MRISVDLPALMKFPLSLIFMVCIVDGLTVTLINRAQMATYSGDETHDISLTQDLHFTSPWNLPIADKAIDANILTGAPVAAAIILTLRDMTDGGTRCRLGCIMSW